MLRFDRKFIGWFTRGYEQGLTRLSPKPSHRASASSACGATSWLQSARLVGWIAAPLGGTTRMPFDYHSCGVLAFSTSNYDAMKKFLADFGFQVAESSDQLLPLFTGKRGARVSRGDLRFQLEESDDPKHRAFFNLFLTDFSDEQLERVQALATH